MEQRPDEAKDVQPDQDETARSLRLAELQSIRRVTRVPVLLLVLAIATALLILFLGDYGRKPSDFVGCFAFDAMMVGFQCQRFPGSGLVELWLNWPVVLILVVPVLLFGGLELLWIAILAVAPVVPHIVVSFRVIREKRRNKAGKA